MAPYTSPSKPWTLTLQPDSKRLKQCQNPRRENHKTKTSIEKYIQHKMHIYIRVLPSTLACRMSSDYNKAKTFNISSNSVFWGWYSCLHILIAVARGWAGQEFDQELVAGETCTMGGSVSLDGYHDLKQSELNMKNSSGLRYSQWWHDSTWRDAGCGNTTTKRSASAVNGFTP